MKKYSSLPITVETQTLERRRDHSTAFSAMVRDLVCKKKQHRHPRCCSSDDCAEYSYCHSHCPPGCVDPHHVEACYGPYRTENVSQPSGPDHQTLRLTGVVDQAGVRFFERMLRRQKKTLFATEFKKTKIRCEGFLTTMNATGVTPKTLRAELEFELVSVVKVKP